MWLDIINSLLNYAVIRYPVPKVKWDKRKFELRMSEIFAYEQAIKKCMDRPFDDPGDTLYEYLLYLYVSELEYEGNKLRIEEYKRMQNVVSNLINRYNSNELNSGRIYI